MDNVLAYLRSREFIERLTATRLAARVATVKGKPLTDDDLAQSLGLPSETAQMLFAFIEAWDLSEAAIAEIATHVAPPAGEAKH
ncbi:hypothetical protein [Mesorhizobium sp. B1-1-7]|uniref:hypothetical protein n=1 Tax=Mesorhizobium sp. B1-1-7 TaxID=2589977 RepID=UPI00112C2837|nr:hypothetical protein [Mesorhizobium sp. B1-1-7]TPN49353.1 hypothetical protein FJ978_19340 [Mesorhizobium sp. B1-1-7]